MKSICRLDSDLVIENYKVNMSFITQLLRRVFGGGLRDQVDDCLVMVRKGLALRLYAKYRPLYGEEKAFELGAAVINALFGDQPTNERGREFIALNGEFVEAALRDLKNEPEICYMVSLATHTRANIAGGTGTLTGEMYGAIVKLTEYGILLPIEKVRMPSSLNELRQQTMEFAENYKIPPSIARRGQ